MKQQFRVARLVFWAGVLSQCIAGCSPRNAVSPSATLPGGPQTAQAEVDHLRERNHRLQAQLVEAEEALAAVERQRGASSDGGGLLLALAEQHPNLRYDPQSGLARFDTEILFDVGNAELDQAAKDRLELLFDLLRAPGAEHLKVVVVGHTDNRQVRGRQSRDRYDSNWDLSAARAVSVAEHLRAVGLQPSRLGVAAYGATQPIAANASRATRRLNRRVEVFVVPPDQPVVGMTESIPDLY